MMDKIDDLKMKGKGLHSTFFVGDASFYPFIKLFGVQCDYTFHGESSSGTCRILFEFSDRENSAASELTLNLSLLKLDANEGGTPRALLTKQILDSLEKSKMEAYDRYRVRPD